MSTQSLGRTLMAVGAAGVIISLLWWLVFYANVAKAMGGPASDLGPVVRCLLVNSGPCGMIKGFASAAGYFAYEPLMMWLSLASLGAGAAIFFSNDSSLLGATARTAAAEQDGASYDKRKFEALAKYDVEISAAVEKVRRLGDKWVAQLGRELLTLGSKEYLASIVAKIEEDAAREAAHIASLPRVVEEGVYRNRKWRRFDTGHVEAETLTGGMKRFESLKEFRAYIS